VERFRAEARSWLEANAPRRRGDRNPAALFVEHGDEAAHLEEARRWQARLADAGWAGITWPPEYGGRGLSPAHQVVWSQEVAAFDVPVDVFGIGMGMAAPTILAWGSDEQKSWWLPPLLRGEEIWCQMFSEPDAGSDVAAVATRAVRDGDEWIVNGQKVWTSGAHYSRWGLLLTRSDPDVPKHAGLTYLVVDMHQPGITVRPLRQMTGGANFTEVFFDDARVPDGQRLGEPGAGWVVAITTLMNERTSIGAIGGLAGDAAAAALLRLFDDLEARVGVNPGDDPLLRDRVVDVAIRGRVLRYHSERIISALVHGGVPTAEGSIAKLALTDRLQRVATLGIDAQGPLGMLAGDDGLADWGDAFLGYPGLRVAGGTDEIMRSVIGERVLGLPREPSVDRDVPFRKLRRQGSS
jgi:alkylation response protein AidB-like acyl-CoA dehydrogenase